MGGGIRTRFGFRRALFYYHLFFSLLADFLGWSVVDENCLCQENSVYFLLAKQFG